VAHASALATKMRVLSAAILADGLQEAPGGRPRWGVL